MAKVSGPVPDRQRLRPSWRALLGSSLLVLPLAAGCGGSGGGPAAAGGNGRPGAAGAGAKPQDAIPVRTAAVRLEPVSALSSTSATLRAEKQAQVKARTRGVIRELLVEAGDRVEADQPLVRLENDEQRIAAERAALVRDTRQREFQRLLQLRGEGMVSEEAFETKRRELEEAENESALADLTLSRTVIRAPFGGVILNRYLDVGATVGDGTDVYDIADLTPLFADVNVPERHVARLGVGQTVRLAADASSDAVPARIERIAPGVDPGTGTVKVTLAVTEATRLRPGAFVRVDIVTDTHPAALVVPRSALVAEGRRWHLFRLENGGESVKQIEVRLGYEEGERVEIAEAVGGEQTLEPGQSVISEGAPALTDGAPVRVMDGEEPSGNGEPLATP